MVSDDPRAVLAEIGKRWTCRSYCCRDVRRCIATVEHLLDYIKIPHSYTDMSFTVHTKDCTGCEFERAVAAILRGEEGE